ncbi:MAG: UbiA family prenyltransferase [Candidatus Hodarchaeota archaeon]
MEKERMITKTRIKDYIDLFRFSLNILACIAVLVAAFIVHVLRGNRANFINFIFNNGILDWIGLIFGLLATILLSAAVQSLNDVYDVEVDIANKRFDRPIARGAFTREFVLYLSTSFFILSVSIIGLLSFIYSITPVLILSTLVFMVIGIGYNYIKHMGFIGNIWVSLGYVAPLFIGFALFDPRETIIIQAATYMLSATFFLATGREIIKDIQDYKGDLEKDMKSLAITLGPKKAAFISLIFFFLTVISCALMGLFIYKNVVFWFFFFFMVGLLCLTEYIVLTEGTEIEGGKKARKYTRWTLWVALGAFFFGVFFVNN